MHICFPDARIPLLTVVATTGHLVQGFFLSYVNLVWKGGLKSAAVGEMGGGRGGGWAGAGGGWGVRMIYIYLSAAAEVKGPSMRHMPY